MSVDLTPGVLRMTWYEAGVILVSPTGAEARPMTDKPTIELELPDEMFAMLQAMAVDAGVSVDEIIGAIVERYLDERNED